MSDPDAFDACDAVGLAGLVRSGQASARQIVEAAIARIERANPAINAVVAKRFEAAMDEAADVAPGTAQPLTGVPFLIKDLGQPYPGMPATDGSRLFAGRLVDERTELVRRYEAAGLIVCGRSNSPEFGVVATTEPLLHGACRNPWRLDRSTGGSSGGAAAAVAAGLVPIAHGGDGGGSIRIPASCCGVFGLKPSRGRTPLPSDATGGFKGLLTVEHVLTRSVRDSALALDVVMHRPGWSLFDSPDPATSFLAALEQPSPRLRIAVLAAPLFNDKLHPECRAAVEAAAALMTDLGHTVDTAFPATLDARMLADAFLDIWCAECAAGLARAQREAGRHARGDDFEVVTWVMGLLGRKLPAVRVAEALAVIQRARIAMDAFLADWDAIVMPTLAAPPPLIGAGRPGRLDSALVHLMRRLPVAPLIAKLDQRFRQEAFQWVGYTPLANLTGQPAMSVPLAWSSDGLPIGVQVLGRVGGEATLLRLAGELENARPWRERRPPPLGGDRV